ncbi:MAG: VOC family protein [Bacteriovoracia bacterium]
MKFGYTLLYVNDVERAQNFYAAAFGLAKGFLHESKQYGEMVTGETKLGFVHHETAGSHGFEYMKADPASRAFGIELGLVTPDVAGAFAQAVKAGAVAVSAPKTKPWGQTVAYVRDCFGFLVEICSPMG